MLMLHEKPGSSEGLIMSPFEQIKMTAVKLGRYKTQVEDHFQDFGNLTLTLMS